ncbi:MAG: hypothetical protein P8182_16435 [Deltaproteobacteria bacterium]
MISIVLSALLLVGVVPGNAKAAGILAGFRDPFPSGAATGQSSIVEGRFGYLWGFDEIWFRDGDNSLIGPAKQEVTLNSLAFGLYGETFLLSDLTARVQAWINVPNEWRNDFLFDGVERAWDSRTRYLGVDLSIAYFFGLGGPPYRAGLVAGYRYNDFDYRSHLVSLEAGSFNDHLQVHIPYLGISYAHSRFMGSVVRLDILASWLTLCRLDGERDLEGEAMQIDGHSVTGFWCEALFAWSFPLTENALAGLFVKYNYLELSGGATVKLGLSETRFSMDSRSHLILTGLTVSYAF